MSNLIQELIEQLQVLQSKESEPRLAMYDKGVIADLHWVALAAGDDDGRPVLKQINVKGGVLQAADGYRTHRVLRDLPDSNASFPSMDDVFPEGDPVATVCIKTQYLRDALEMGAERVVIKVYAKGKPITVESRDSRAIAAIMPVYMRENLS